MQREWNDLLTVLEALKGGQIGITAGCRRVTALGHALGEGHSDLFLPFVGVDSETDRFPMGDVRELWSADALWRVDKERAEIEAHYSPFVMRAIDELLKYLAERLPRH
jgi:hypothetical protein